MFKALVIGGTGLISTGVVRHLLARGASVTVFNRAQRERSLLDGVLQLVGDRNDSALFERTFSGQHFDVVYDMICFSPEQAAATVAVFRGRCQQLVFCSTVCVYGVKVPSHVLIDEEFPLEPVSEYGRNKVACERIFERAAATGAFEVTVARPSHTYGPGAPLIDQHELDGGAWDRVARGQPVLMCGDGLGLWQSTHRDDCARFFAYAALSPQTYGQAYNVVRDEVLTWRNYYREVARALETRAKLLFAPASWLIAQAPERFGLLAEVTQFHGAYSAHKAKAHVPEFRAAIELEAGARETFADERRRGAWHDSRTDLLYQNIVERALASGFRVEEA